MLNLESIFKAQRRYGVSTAYIDTESVTYETYLHACRNALNDRTPVEYHSWEASKRNTFTENVIVNYVRNNQKIVEGYVDDDGEVDQTGLVDRLKTDITDFGILRGALEDDSIQEVQINDYKTIWVVRKGKSELYVDQSGKPYQFVSDMELQSTIGRMINDGSGDVPRMTDKSPLLNARTAGTGYRVSAVHPSAITSDNTVGFNFPCTSVTIRKYASEMLTFADLIRFGSLTEEMAELLKYCGLADIRLACVGATSSGKTTLLNVIVWECDKSLRIILVQNPTEVTIYDRSEETGVNRRNTLHWEAKDVSPEEARDPSSPSMSNLMAHTLRNTPDIIVPGEVRTAEEFVQVNRILKTGHRILTTWHATDGADAIDRASTELASISGNATEYTRSLANSFDITVAQMKLRDGSRKVMAIEEITGEVKDGRAVSRPIFEFVLTGEADKDPVTGDVLKIHGYYQQVNPLSDKLLKKFYAAGITKTELKRFIDVPPVIKGRSNLGSDGSTKESSLQNEINDL